jgi:uncharacterized membrane protein
MAGIKDDLRVTSVTRVVSPLDEIAHQDTGLEASLGLDLAQGVRVLTGLAWIGWSVSWWLGTGNSPITPLMTMFALVGGLVVIGISVHTHSADRWRVIDLRILIGTLVIIGLWLAVHSSTHAYETDELTTGQASATVLLSGHNPYGADLTQALAPFNSPPQISTPIFGGGVVHTISYPALSFLLYVPFGAVLGVGAPYALVADGVAWIVLMALLWRVVDVRLRPVVPLLASFTLYVTFVDGGVTDMLFLPFLCLAVFRWDRFLSSHQPRHLRWLGPVCLGLACSVKPTPWLIAPFLLAAVTVEAARRGVNPWRVALRYTGVSVGAFLVVNGPFIAMDPAAWVHGALLPFAEPLVPFGLGIVQLPLYLHMAGGHVAYLGVAGLGALVASLGAFTLSYPRTRRMLPLMATVPLLLSSRSLVNYFLYVAILVLVDASGTGRSPVGWVRDRATFRWLGRGLAGLGGVAAVAATAAFLLSPAPLQLTVAGEHHHLDAAGNATVSLTVVAANVSDRPVRPTFAVTSGGFINPSWRATAGPAVVPAHTRATYELLSTDSATTIPRGTIYLVDALAPDPDSVSTSDWVTAP